MNRIKSQVVHFSRIKFLGYSFYNKKGEVRFRIHPKSIYKLRDNIRFLSSRSNGWGYSARKEKLSAFIIGWINYFKYADIKNLLVRIDEWLRRRLRMVIWKQWKLVRTRFHNLIKLGIPKRKAWEWANSRKAYWRVAKSFILNRTLTNENLSKAGYLFFSDYYLKVRVG